MKKSIKFLKSFLFVILWLAISSYFEKYWRIFHWEFIFLNIRQIFDHIFWFTLKNFLFDFDIGFYLEETFKFVSYELPKELFKYIPIYLFIKFIWIKNPAKIK
tara:strand:+ start:47 stop:355 length:309 start_codon:yes stop_codon:yes gene_type:complete